MKEYRLIGIFIVLLLLGVIAYRWNKSSTDASRMNAEFKNIQEVKQAQSAMETILKDRIPLLTTEIRQHLTTYYKHYLNSKDPAVLDNLPVLKSFAGKWELDTTDIKALANYVIAGEDPSRVNLTLVSHLLSTPRLDGLAYAKLHDAYLDGKPNIPEEMVKFAAYVKDLRIHGKVILLQDARAMETQYLGSSNQYGGGVKVKSGASPSSYDELITTNDYSPKTLNA